MARRIQLHPPRSGPQVRAGKIDEIIAATVEHGFHHVEREAFGHVDGNGGGERRRRTATHPHAADRAPLGKRGEPGPLRSPPVSWRGTRPPATLRRWRA